MQCFVTATFFHSTISLILFSRHLHLINIFFITMILFHKSFREHGNSPFIFAFGQFDFSFISIKDHFHGCFCLSWI